MSNKTIVLDPNDMVFRAAIRNLRQAEEQMHELSKRGLKPMNRETMLRLSLAVLDIRQTAKCIARDEHE